ncbi:winged helix-turn-helix transcriptional regulator [Flavobacterium sp. RHBU_24]|uniref:winged helix-turn-helix transcriptional regulator n=1 Tax=Flavobacterium sp. RHBU_24 TaxID=3391185 RepID=UPI0039848E0B
MEANVIQLMPQVNCHKAMVMPIKDALEALSGKWKLPILVTLSSGPKRFKEIAKEVGGITDKVLSKELKDMELNKLVKRTVYDTFPPTVEYAWTDHSRTLGDVMHALEAWGKLHRKTVIGGYQR